MTETTGQAPQNPHHRYGAYPPPPSPRTSGRKTGLIVGGVVAVVVLLTAFVAVVVVVGQSAGEDNSASLDGGIESNEESEPKYRLNAYPCDAIKVDVEELGVNGSMNGAGNETGDGSGSFDCMAKLQKSAGDSEDYVLFSAQLNVNGSEQESMYDSFIGQYLERCETSELSGAWDKGTLGDCSSGSTETTGVVIQDANVDMMFLLENHGDLGIDDPEDLLTPLLEKMLDDLRA